MFKEVLMKQLKTKNIVYLSIYFIIYMFIYTLLDYFNGGYVLLKNNYGLYLPIINILLNLIMSLISALMMGLSTSLVKLSGKEGKGTFLSSLSVLFGLLTYGCTSCVIAFFATVGITFSVAVLPLAGLPYKFISLFIIIVGLLWLINQINNTNCRVELGGKK